MGAQSRSSQSLEESTRVLDLIQILKTILKIDSTECVKFKMEDPVEKKFKLEPIECPICQSELQGRALVCMHCLNSVCYAHKGDMAELKCPMCSTKYPADQLSEWGSLLSSEVPVDQIDFSRLEMPPLLMVEKACVTSRGLEILKRYLETISIPDWCFFVKNRAIEEPIAFNLPLWEFLVDRFWERLVTFSCALCNVLDMLRITTPAVAKVLRPLYKAVNPPYFYVPSSWARDSLARYLAMNEALDRAPEASDFKSVQASNVTKELLDYLVTHELHEAARECAAAVLYSFDVAQKDDSLLQEVLKYRPQGWIYERYVDTNPLLEKYRPMGFCRNGQVVWTSQEDWKVFGTLAPVFTGYVHLCYSGCFFFSNYPKRQCHTLYMLTIGDETRFYTSRQELPCRIPDKKQYEMLKEKLSGRRINAGVINFRNIVTYTFSNELTPF